MENYPEEKYNQLYALFEQLPFMSDDKLSPESKLEKLRNVADELSLSHRDVLVLEQILRDDNFAHAMGIYYETKGLAQSGDEGAKLIYDDLKPFFHQALMELVSKQ